MRVHFQNTLDDYRALLRSFPLRKRLEWSLAFPLWLVAISLPGTGLLIFLRDWYALAVGWALLAAFIGWIFLNVRRSWRTPDPKALAPSSVWFDEVSVSCESGFGWSRRDWTLMYDVRETENHILLFTAESEAFAIPRRAFASSAEAAEFAAAARRAFQRSREPSYVPFAPPLPAEAVAQGPAGIISALQVRYQNTTEELVTMQSRGLANLDSLSKRMAGWFWLAVLGGFVLWLTCQRSAEQQWEAGQVGSFIIFTWLFIVGMQFWQTFQTWKARRSMDPYRLAPQVLTITPAGVSSHTPLHEHAHNWSAIDEISGNERFVVLYLTRPRFLAVVPKTAFASPLDAEQFMQLARQWKLAASATGLSNAAARVETGNPYQSPEEQ